MGYPYTMTGESVSVVIKGKTYTVKKSDENYPKVRKAVFDEEWDIIPALLNKGLAIEKWMKGLFTYDNNHLWFKGEKVAEAVSTRAITMAAAGNDPQPLMRFWQRLQQNPSWRSVNQLWRFLENSGIPIGEDGCFLAYKAVRNDLWDKHSQTIQYNLGAVIEMSRNKISDDPAESCAPGLHVGAKGYLGSLYSSDTWLIVKVDPKDVVAVPNDYKSQKMRVCKMTVLGHYTAELPDTVWDDDILEELTDEQKANVAEQIAAAVKELPESAIEPIGESVDVWDTPVKADLNIEVVEEGETPTTFVADALVAETKSYGNLGGPTTETRTAQLGAKKLSELRVYARHSLGILNVKAIKGGKPTLIERIIAVETDSLQVKTKHATKTPVAAGDIQYADMDALGVDALNATTLSVLRKYARHHLKVIGASKLPGGKTALVDAIVNARSVRTAAAAQSTPPKSS